MKSILLVTLLWTGLLGSLEASSCSFIPRSTAEYFEQASRVYLAKLKSKSLITGVNGLTAEMEVLETFKGNPGKVATVRPGIGGGGCGFYLQMDIEYIVFQGEDDAMSLVTGSISLDDPLSPDLEKKMLETLRKLKSEHQ